MKSTGWDEWDAMDQYSFYKYGFISIDALIKGNKECCHTEK